jgi:hypothetical protein
MNEKTKIVEIAETRYQLRRFTPDVGSFILMQIIGASLKGQENVEARPEAAPPASEQPKGEDLVRAVTFSAFLHGLDFEAHRFIQGRCLALCSRMEGEAGQEAPMPIVNGTGVALPELRDNMQLVMQLEMEVLVFNFSDFFAGGGLKNLAGARPSKA